MSTSINWPTEIEDFEGSAMVIRGSRRKFWTDPNLLSINPASLPDLSGSGNPMVVSGALAVDGPRWKAFSFDGANDYCAVSGLPVGDMSVCLAFKVAAKPVAHVRLFSQAGVDPANDRYIGINPAGDVVAATRLVDGTTLVSAVIPAAAWVAGDWVHVFASFGRLGVAIYKDGDPVGSTSHAEAYSGFSDVRIGSKVDATTFTACEIEGFEVLDFAAGQIEAIRSYLSAVPYEAFPLYPQQSGYAEVLQDGTVRSPTDMGPGKTRRRFTALSTYIQVEYNLTHVQKQELVYFYKYTVRGGSLSFNWPAPDGSTVEARFTAPINISAADDGATAVLALEVMP